MTLDLSTGPLDDDALPLGFEVGDRLVGRKREAPYMLPNGRPAAGKALTRHLGREGIGPHKLVVSGLYVPQGSGPAADLVPWSRSTTTLGTLDPMLLGRIVHDMVRRFVESVKGEDTPPEVYVTRIEVNPARRAAPKPKAKRARKPRYWTTRYRDRETGRLVSRDTWERSRRALRAHAKRRKTTPGAGRYVRERAPVY